MRIAIKERNAPSCNWCSVLLVLLKYMGHGYKLNKHVPYKSLIQICAKLEKTLALAWAPPTLGLNQKHHISSHLKPVFDLLKKNWHLRIYLLEISSIFAQSCPNWHQFILY